jgi:hypothetical protein
LNRVNNWHIHNVTLGNGGNGGNCVVGLDTGNGSAGGGYGGGGGGIGITTALVSDTTFESITFGNGGNGGNAALYSEQSSRYSGTAVAGFGRNGGGFSYASSITFNNCAFISIMFGDAGIGGQPSNSSANYKLFFPCGAGGGGFIAGGWGSSYLNTVDYSNYGIPEEWSGLSVYFCPVCYFDNIVFGKGSSGIGSAMPGGDGGYAFNGGDGAGDKPGADGGDVYSSQSLPAGTGGANGGTDGESLSCP